MRFLNPARIANSQRVGEPARRYLLSFVLVLGSVLLLAQGIELGHSHDDLESQLDCQICLKHSSKGKLLAASDLDFGPGSANQFAARIQLQKPFLALPPANSRAPPVLI